MSGFPQSSTIAFGISYVTGLSRVPSPAARIIAFINHLILKYFFHCKEKKRKFKNESFFPHFYLIKSQKKVYFPKTIVERIISKRVYFLGIFL